MSGKGILRYENGDIYNGYFKSGVKNGHGVYWENNNMKDGILRYKTGDKYEGSF